LLAALLVFLFGLPRDAAACDCFARSAPCAAVPRTAAVFVGKVERASATEVTFAIERHVRGTGNASTITLTQRHSNCAYLFTAGERYVVYAHRDEAGHLQTSICTRTKPVDLAGDDLAYFDELLRPAAGARVDGRIRHVDHEFADGRGVDYGPLADRTVTLSGPAARREMRTDRDGRFDFRGLPRGTYELRIDLPERFAPWRPVRVQLDDERACSAFDSIARFNGRVTGQLLDEDGQPSAGVALEIAAASTRDAATPPYVRSVTTAADGRFEFAPLPPGTYVLGTELSQRRQGHHRDRRRYFAGGAGSDGTIHLDAGGAVQLTPFQLPALASARVIEGTVRWPDGTLAAGATVEVFGAGPEPHVSSDGRFRFELPYGAQFTLHAHLSITRDGRRVYGESVPRVVIDREDRDRVIELRLRAQ
jgi:hypothetical protein